jgi:hypothetical protein
MAEYLPAQLETVRKPQVDVEAPTKQERAPTTHPLLSLQSRAGNQAVARMVQRQGAEDEIQAKHDTALQREESAEAEEEELQAKHDPALQREESAEAEDEELQAKHDPALQREESAEAEDEELQAKHDPALQRAGEEDELQMKHDDSPKVGLDGGPVGADIENQIDSMRGTGSAPPDGLRRQMEAATGANLSGVRVHEGAESDSLNKQLTAKAFTTGNDIFLRGDQSASDSTLMAHEMAHVVQQSSGRMAAGGNGMSAGAANDPLEAEADNLAHAVLSGNVQRHSEEEHA